MNFDKVREVFKSRGKEKEFSEYEESYCELTKRKKNSCKVQCQGEWGDSKWIREYALALCQIFLHRSTKLFSGSMEALCENNVYLMTLSTRGHFEATAAIGYLYNRLESLRKGCLDSCVVCNDIACQLLGSKEEGLLSLVKKEGLKVKPVLTMLKYADKSISRDILDGTTKEHDILSDSYLFLCEYSHPNFHSNKVAFDLDKKEQEIKIRNKELMRDNEFNLIGYLLISSSFFIKLFDKIYKVVPNE